MAKQPSKKQKIAQPFLQARPTARCIMQGDFVMTPDGDVGMVQSVQAIGRTVASIQFVHNGPTFEMDWGLLRQATEQEIKAAGLEGVGCNPYRG